LNEEAAAQNFKTQIKVKVRTENGKIEELKSNRCMDNSSGSWKDHL